jgi:hypothetical protein
MHFVTLESAKSTVRFGSTAASQHGISERLLLGAYQPLASEFSRDAILGVCLFQYRPLNNSCSNMTYAIVFMSFCQAAISIADDSLNRLPLYGFER